MKNIEGIGWVPVSPHCLITIHNRSKILPNIYIMLPEETPDNMWKMFISSSFGIKMYNSKDGMSWSFSNYITFFDKDPFIFSYGEYFYLLSVSRFANGTNVFPFFRKNNRIIVRRSVDLKRWSIQPSIYIPSKSNCFSSPSLITVGDKIKLYFSFSESYVKKIKVNMPLSWCSATFNEIDNRFEFLNELEYIKETKKNSYYENISIGRINPVLLGNQIISTQCNVYYDFNNKRIESEISFLKSITGSDWHSISLKEKIKSSQLKKTGAWYFTSSRLKYSSCDNAYYLFYVITNDEGVSEVNMMVSD